MILNPTHVVIGILVCWAVFIGVVLHSSKKGLSIANQISGLTKTTGELLLAIEILVWSLFPLFLYSARVTLAIIDPVLISAISFQLFLFWLGASLITFIVFFVAIRQEKIVISIERKSHPRTVIIEILILAILFIVSVDMTL